MIIILFSSLASLYCDNKANEKRRLEEETNHKEELRLQIINEYRDEKIGPFLSLEVRFKDKVGLNIDSMNKSMSELASLRIPDHHYYKVKDSFKKRIFLGEDYKNLDSCIFLINIDALGLNIKIDYKENNFIFMLSSFWDGHNIPTGMKPGPAPLETPGYNPNERVGILVLNGDSTISYAIPLPNTMKIGTIEALYNSNKKSYVGDYKIFNKNYDFSHNTKILEKIESINLKILFNDSYRLNKCISIPFKLSKEIIFDGVIYRKILLNGGPTVTYLN